jgi:hypothetical protein
MARARIPAITALGLIAAVGVTFFTKDKQEGSSARLRDVVRQVSRRGWNRDQSGATPA